VVTVVRSLVTLLGPYYKFSPDSDCEIILKIVYNLVKLRHTPQLVFTGVLTFSVLAFSTPLRIVLVFSVLAFSILAKCPVSYLHFPYLHFLVLAISAPPPM